MKHYIIQISASYMLNDTLEFTIHGDALNEYEIRNIVQDYLQADTDTSRINVADCTIVIKETDETGDTL